jgi:hypothetical protein
MPYLLGRSGTTFREWAEMHKAELLQAVNQPAG